MNPCRRVNKIPQGPPWRPVFACRQSAPQSRDCFQNTCRQNYQPAIRWAFPLLFHERESSGAIRMAVTGTYNCVYVPVACSRLNSAKVSPTPQTRYVWINLKCSGQRSSPNPSIRYYNCRGCQTNRVSRHHHLLLTARSSYSCRRR